MIIEKARNQIQCYWENKPSGCRKPHCVFRHSKRSNGRNNSNNASANVVNAGANHSVMATAGSIDTKQIMMKHTHRKHIMHDNESHEVKL